MSMNKIIFLLLVSVFIVSTISIANASVTGYTTDANASKCNTPAKSLFVGTVTGDKFNVSSITVDKNTCYAITFVNTDSAAHTFTIGNTVEPTNVTYYNLYAASQKTSNTTNYLTPNVDITLKYYCAVPGHSSTMFGDFIVGKGSSSGSSPGFEVISVFFGLFAFVGITTLYHKKKQT